MARQWTDKQNEALSVLDRDVCVAAGAGSGKTGVLVERIVRIVRGTATGELPLDQRAGIDEMLVITFTDKATREMKQRLVREFTQQAMQEERRKVETAYISTIHGFCSRLLKENPFEAGVSPVFTVLLGPDAARLERACFEKAIEAAFATSDEDTIELVAAAQEEGIFRRNGADPINSLAAAVAQVTDRLRAAGIRLEQARAHWAGGCDVTAARSLDPVRTLLAPVLGEIDACRRALSAMRTVGGAVRDSLLEALATPDLQPTASAPPAHLLACLGALTRVAGTLKSLTRRLRGPEAADPDLQAAVARLRVAIEQVAPFANAVAESEEQAALTCHRVWGLATAAWTEYAEAKRAAGCLDVTDLQAEAVRLLEDSVGVLRRYRRRFRYILVDEFQDTDPLQMRLLALLHGEAGPTAEGPYGNRLFVVGDVQQSIYGFRNADPAIFREHSRRFRDGAAGRYVTMATNFRSRPEILRFTNEAFRRVWSGSRTPHAPSDAGAEHDMKDQPSIEVLVARVADRRSYVELEAAALAERLHSMVERQQVRITHHDDHRRGEPVRWGDVAILLRALTHIEVYEGALAKRGIPYFVVGGGRGYYARMEIRDVANLLKALDTPLDDIAVASALRSPMAGVGTDTLHALAVAARDHREATGGRLYPAIPLLLQQCSLPGTESEGLGAFYAMAERLRSDLDRTHVGLILERALKETRYDARLLVRPGGRRRLANVRKLLQMALANPEDRVADFVTRLADLTQLSEREGDAPTEEEASDVVRLITVHGAKGLEFPVVVVADMSRRPGGSRTPPFLCDPAAMALGSHLGGYQSVPHRAIELRRKQADSEEETRVLYVAMTRAREHLMLCGSTQSRSAGEAWSDMIFPQAAITYPQQPETRVGLGGVAMRLVPMESLVTARNAGD